MMNLNKIITAFSSLCLLVSCGQSSDSISLEGEWGIELDRKSEGVAKKWYEGHDYVSSINLPTSTDVAGYGNEPPKVDINNQWTFGWKRQKVYAGAAWYEREVNIPSSWEGKHIELFLEELRSESAIWVDGVRVPGDEISLVTPHRHDLSKYLTPGQHRITIKLDNSNMRNIAGSYARSEMGQGNWQGIVGDIELRASDPVYIDHVRLETLNLSECKVEVKVANTSGTPVQVQGTVDLLDGRKVVASAPLALAVAETENLASVKLNIKDLTLWSEFHPQLYDLKVNIQGKDFKDEYVERTGLRIVGRNEDHQITINGNKTFLRGTLNYNIFPMTGYPPTEIDEWLRIFRITQNWGFNHIRFHSLTPPEAAFEAADQLGMYLQCECPKAGIMGQNLKDDDFLASEGLKILRDFGNHPSFIMLSIGNELSGPEEAIYRVYDRVRRSDNRVLHTASTGGAPERNIGGDYRVYGSLVRGLKGPQTNWDYNETLQSLDKTIISHETGQWHVYPSMKVIPKYQGAMQPDNLEIIKADLEKKGMLDKAELFTQTTGAFQSVLYKEELESLFRTKNMGGFQMHNLNDFPAQGTATSGFLDIFYDEKGYMTAERFREFVAPVVPLARMPKRLYTASENFVAEIDLANYLEEPISGSHLDWSIRNGEEVIALGRLDKPVLDCGNVFSVGEISVPLHQVKDAAKLELLVEVAGTEYRNRWNFWVYPDNEVAEVDETIQVAYHWKDAKALLEKGEKVLYLTSREETKRWRPGKFLTVYWSPVWLQRGEETMSVLADTDHPALKRFPTDPNTDWQWFDVLENSFAMGIDDLPIDFQPIVYVIDSYRKNERLANLFEAKVGKGKLMVSSIDFQNNLEKDMGRSNLRNSVLDYMESEHFNPSQTLEMSMLDKMFTPEVRTSKVEFPEMKQAVVRVKAEHPVSKADNPYKIQVDVPIVTSGKVTAWVNKKDIWVDLQCPDSQEGTLYLYMRNTAAKQWGFLKTKQEKLHLDYVVESKLKISQSTVGPTSVFIINDQVVETIDGFGATGQWYALPVHADQMKEGNLKLQISTLNNPNIVTEIAYVPKF